MFRLNLFKPIKSDIKVGSEIFIFYLQNNTLLVMFRYSLFYIYFLIPNLKYKIIKQVSKKYDVKNALIKISRNRKERGY